VYAFLILLSAACSTHLSLDFITVRILCEEYKVDNLKQGLTTDNS
jgi:hypothetical protein